MKKKKNLVKSNTPNKTVKAKLKLTKVVSKLMKMVSKLYSLHSQFQNGYTT